MFDKYKEQKISFPPAVPVSTVLKFSNFQFQGTFYTFCLRPVLCSVKVLWTSGDTNIRYIKPGGFKQVSTWCCFALLTQQLIHQRPGQKVHEHTPFTLYQIVIDQYVASSAGTLSERRSYPGQDKQPITPTCLPSAPSQGRTR